jgi:hypothetical protein
MLKDELQLSYTLEDSFQFTKDSLQFIIKMELLSNDVNKIKQNMSAEEKQCNDLNEIKTKLAHIKKFCRISCHYEMAKVPKSNYSLNSRKNYKSDIQMG